MQVPSKYSICKFLVDSWLVFNFFSLILLDSFKSLWLNLLLIPDIFHQNCRFPQSVFFAASLTGLVSSLRITTLITLLIIYLAKNIKERSDTQSMNIILFILTITLLCLYVGNQNISLSVICLCYTPKLTPSNK